MDEGRKFNIYLPNDETYSIQTQPKQLGKDLLETACKKLLLKETTYFGLIFTHNDIKTWLPEDKKLCDSLPDEKQLKCDVLNLYFSVKFFEDSITVLKHTTTVEMFFIHALQQVHAGDLEVSVVLGYELAALALQAAFGCYESNETTVENMNNYPALAQHLKERCGDENVCEREIIERYKHQSALTRGEAVMSFMSKVENLHHYGMHYFKVKDKSRTVWWLGISSKGIFQYSYHDKTNPSLVLYWKSLENLYFREKKFSVEVCSTHKRSNSSGLSHSNKKKSCKTHNWYGSTGLIKSIWIMAIAQHQFYTEKRKSNKVHKRPINVITNIANALTTNPSSLVDSLKESTMMRHKRLINNNPHLIKSSKEKLSPEYLALEEGMIAHLNERRTGLEDQLYNKVQELKKICLAEAEITGKYPIEYLRYTLPNEKLPPLKKKIGAEFKVKMRNKNNQSKQAIINNTLPRKSDLKPIIPMEEELEILEEEFNILTQITNASLKLAQEPSLRRKMKRRRLNSYKKSLTKLQDLEAKMNEMRMQQGHQPTERASRFITDVDLDTIAKMGHEEASTSEKSSLSEGIMLDDELSLASSGDALSTHSTPVLHYNDVDESQSADIDMMDIRRCQTPPVSHNWNDSNLLSPAKRKHWNEESRSYALMSSPGSGRSLNSQNSASPKRGHKSRHWIKPEWGAAKYEIPNMLRKPGWAESSLDSFELDSLSINSRKSGGLPSDASPVVENKSFPSIEDNKYENDKKSNSGQSLTDSGHVSPSHPITSHEGIISNLPRDISDSSLSQLSTQSNPTVMPSLHNNNAYPKFYPQSLKPANTRTIHEGQVYENHNDSLRKRSSSFTETDKQNVYLTHRNNHPALSRSKTSDFSAEESRRKNSDVHRDFSTRTYSSRFSRSSSKQVKCHQNNETNDSPAPSFATNDNIRTKYLSRSQGQLINDVSTTTTVTSTTATTVPNVNTSDSVAVGYLKHNQVRNELQLQANFSYNNNSNIYRDRTQSNVTPQTSVSQPAVTQSLYSTTRSYNDPYAKYTKVQKTFKIPDDEYAPDSVKNYAAEEEDKVPPLQDESNSLNLPSYKVNQLNNEVYKEIGLGWVPSLHEYSSRASVAESMTAKCKKEDIRELLQQHVSSWRRTPSNVSNRSREAKIRLQQAKELKKYEHNNMKLPLDGKSWEAYKETIQRKPQSKYPSQEHYWKTDKRRNNLEQRTNIFMHNAPPEIERPNAEYQSIVPGYPGQIYNDHQRKHEPPQPDGSPLSYNVPYNTGGEMPRKNSYSKMLSAPPNSYVYATMSKKQLDTRMTKVSPVGERQTSATHKLSTDYYYSLPRKSMRNKTQFKSPPSSHPIAPITHGSSTSPAERLFSNNQQLSEQNHRTAYYNTNMHSGAQAVVQQVGRNQYYTVKDSFNDHKSVSETFRNANSVNHIHGGHSPHQNDLHYGQYSPSNNMGYSGTTTRRTASADDLLNEYHHQQNEYQENSNYESYEGTLV